MRKSWQDWFIIFSGEDYQYISKSDAEIKWHFTKIGAFVILILVSCLFSAYLFTDSLFHSPIQDIGIALIWGAIVTNLYVLLLYTISPTILPFKNKKAVKPVEIVGFNISLSFVIRIFMLVVLAFITAQPINVFVFSGNTYNYVSAIKTIMASESNAWLITLVVCALFILPVYWKYSIRNRGNFYQIKTDIEKRIILDDYNEFKNLYSQILSNNVRKYNEKVWENLSPQLLKIKSINADLYKLVYNKIQEDLSDEKITKYEYWANPPFRTFKYGSQKRLSEEDLIKYLYNEE